MPQEKRSSISPYYLKADFIHYFQTQQIHLGEIINISLYILIVDNAFYYFFYYTIVNPHFLHRHPYNSNTPLPVMGKKDLGQEHFPCSASEAGFITQPIALSFLFPHYDSHFLILYGRGCYY